MTTERRSWRRAAILCLTCALGGFLVVQSQTTPPERVGPLPDGGFLLNSGWTLHPAGDEIPVDTFPMRAAVSNNGKFLLVLNGGYNPPSISVIDIAGKKEVGRTPLPDCWFGLIVSPKNDLVYASGGTKGVVYELSLDPASGALSRRREFAAVAAGDTSKVMVGDVAITPDAHILYAANLPADSVSVINLQSGMLTDTWKVGRRPYRVLVTRNAREILVSSWADAAVYQYDANSGKEIAKTRVGPHSTDMVLLSQPPPSENSEETSSYAGRLFVAAANTNSVYSLGITSDLQLTPLETINVSLTPMHPLGMTPSAVAVSPDGSQLYVVCSDANAVAVVDISGPRAFVRGFIPTGWYPTAVQPLSDGSLAILNGKGLGSHPNATDGPSPIKGDHVPGYIPHQQTGTVALVEPVHTDQLHAFTQTVLNSSPYRDELMDGAPSSDQEAFFTRREGHPSPVQHVIYVIKENRTYDQVLGDLDRGNGDKSLTLFGEQVTPNEHQLARDFILYDNFYENSDVSAEGHNWANAAIAPDYTVKTWPSNYAGRKKTYDYEGTEPANTPPAGYIWDNAVQAGLTIRNYGEWDESTPQIQSAGKTQIKSIQDPVLANRVDMDYRAWDLNYPDTERAREFLREWKDFDAKGDAPNLLVVRLGNDHTMGTRPGALTPIAYAAQNDYAVGMLVDGVSHSKLWSSTAIFIIEDDAQNGPDHVDSHRSTAFVISPYTRRGIVDSTMYNQMSILRTMELLIGLRPLTHFDAGATPMFASFTQQANLQPYSAISPKTSTTERNAGNAPGAADSARMDFSEPDKADEDLLNAAIWRSVKHTDPPPPTRSAFSR